MRLADRVHVLPVDDAIEHVDVGCVCGPDLSCRIDLYDEGDHWRLVESAWLVTHHALDGRV